MGRGQLYGQGHPVEPTTDVFDCESVDAEVERRGHTACPIVEQDHGCVLHAERSDGPDLFARHGETLPRRGQHGDSRAAGHNGDG